MSRIPFWFETEEKGLGLTKHKIYILATSQEEAPLSISLGRERNPIYSKNILYVYESDNKEESSYIQARGLCYKLRFRSSRKNRGLSLEYSIPTPLAVHNEQFDLYRHIDMKKLEQPVWSKTSYYYTRDANLHII